MSASQKINAAAPALMDTITGLNVDLAGIIRLADLKEDRLGRMAAGLLPGVKSVIVVAMELFPEILDLTSPSRTMGAASLNDLYADNSEFISGKLTERVYDLTRVSRKQGLKALPLSAAGCPTDNRFLEAVFSFKHAGEAAGMGKMGWHSLLITPGFGPRVRLACCLTEAELESTVAGDDFIDCQSCRLCVEACPAGAIKEPVDGEPYAINKYACGSYRASACGCSECMKVCPQGR